jgi:hypothetical protein
MIVMIGGINESVSNASSIACCQLRWNLHREDQLNALKAFETEQSAGLTAPTRLLEPSRSHGSWYCAVMWGMSPTIEHQRRSMPRQCLDHVVGRALTATRHLVTRTIRSIDIRPASRCVRCTVKLFDS